MTAITAANINASREARPRRLEPGALMIVPALLWLVLFGVVPMILLGCMSLWRSTIFGIEMEWNLDNYRTIFSDDVYMRVLAQTLRIALASTVLSLILSYPLAYFLASAKGRKKTALVLLVFLPFWTSYVIRSYVWLPMLGRQGLVNQVLLWLGVVDAPIDWFLFNEGTVYLGLVYVYMLFMTLPIYLSLDRLDPKLVEAANDLGARPAQTFVRVVLPLSMPGVLSGCTMVFLLACGVYVTPQLLGGPSAVMFGNIIASQFLTSNNWALGAALSVILVVLVLGCLYLAGLRWGLQRLFMGAGH
jgi:spermidine/putrescine transport system permease protein